MKRILAWLVLIIVVFFGGRFIGHWEKEPTYVEPTSTKFPGWQRMRKVETLVREECKIYSKLDPRNGYDQEVFNAVDYWQDCRKNPLVNGQRGDCEDHALAFMNLLRERYPVVTDYTAIYYVDVTYEGQTFGHAIAIVNHPDGNRYVFDTRFEELESLKDVAHHYTGLRETEQRGTNYVFVERGNA